MALGTLLRHLAAAYHTPRIDVQLSQRLER